MEITMEQREAYSEVLEVLRHMEKKYIDMIPKKVIMFFYDNCRLDYDFFLTESLDKAKLKSQTVDLLSLLNSSYWHRKTSKEDVIMQYGIPKYLNDQLEKENAFTKIDVENAENGNFSNLPAVITDSFNIAKKVFVFIKDLIIKIFGD